MNALKLGLAAALICTGAFAQTAATTTPSGTSPTTMGTTGGTMGTTGGVGTTGRTVPGATTNTPAQLSPSNNSSATPPAVTTSNANAKTAAAPVKGRNSFTMNEARRRIEKGGFTQVTGLKKDADGIWRGKAMKSGASVDVYCDYQGNVGAAS